MLTPMKERCATSQKMTAQETRLRLYHIVYRIALYQARYTYMLMFSSFSFRHGVSIFSKTNIYRWQNKNGIYNFKFMIFLLQLVLNSLLFKFTTTLKT